MLPHGELTLREAASSGARSVPGEGGWAKGSTLVGGLPGAPMICVSKIGVCANTATLTPGSMTSRKELLHTKGAERGFRKGVGPKFERRRCGEVPGILESPTNFFSLLRSLSSMCTQDTVRVQMSCLAATRDQLKESDENNNKTEEKQQASSRSSIFGQGVLSVSHAVVSSRKKSPIRLQRKREREVPDKKKIKEQPQAKAAKKELKNKPRPFEAANPATPRAI